MTKTDCYFYHTIDLPSETVDGDWDYRTLAEKYTGEVDFTGKTFLDVGAATGFFSFFAESRGAKRVVSYDAPDGANYNLIPWVENDHPAIAEASAGKIVRMKRGYQYCHAALGSKTQPVFGEIYDLPDSLGQFDIGLLGSILLHLRDPFLAIQNVAARCSTVVITDLDIEADGLVFAPNYAGSGQRNPNDTLSWWHLPAKTISRMLDVMGFTTERVVKLSAYSPTMKYHCALYALVATRRPC